MEIQNTNLLNLIQSTTVWPLHQGTFNYAYLFFDISIPVPRIADFRKHISKLSHERYDFF